MSFFVSSGLYSFIANLLIAVFVYTRNRKQQANILFVLFSLSVSGWSFGSFLVNVIPDEHRALLVLRLNYLFAVWLPSFYIHFVYALSRTTTQVSKIKLRFSYGLSLLLSPIVLTSAFIPALRLIPGTDFRISVAGPFYYVFFAFFGIAMMEVILHTLFRIPRYHGNQRRQMIFITVANAIAIFAGFEYFSRVFGLINAPPWDDYILVAYLLVVAYAIVRHRLMDIDVIIKKTLVFAGLFAMVLAIIAAVTTLFHGVLGQYWKVSNTTETLISVAIAVLLYNPARVLLVFATDKFLFQRKSEIKEVLNRLARDVISILEIDKVSERIISTLYTTLRLESGAILVKEEDEANYRVLGAFGPVDKAARFAKEDLFIRFFAHQELIVNLENPENQENLPSEIVQDMEKLKAVIALPLFSQKDLIGVLLMGKKRSDQEFTQEEIDYFPTLASQVAVSMSNARLYDILKKSQIDFAQQAKMAAIGTLSAGISHEIKNPLNHIKVGISMLRMNKKHGVLDELDRYKFEDEIFKTLDILDQNVTRANEVIERLSSFAKKPKELNIAAVSLEETVDRAMAFIKNELDHHKVIFEKKFPEDFPKIKADHHTLEDIFLNLIVNARHGIGDGGHITVEGIVGEGELEVLLKDTGKGIKKENLDKIWDPFFTTKDVSRNPDKNAVKGSGLGLFIVREFIQRFGGNIYAESEEGKGTVFHIVFPEACWYKEERVV